MIIIQQLEDIKMYGRHLSDFLTPDQRDILLREINLLLPADQPKEGEKQWETLRKQTAQPTELCKEAVEKHPDDLSAQIQYVRRYARKF